MKATTITLLCIVLQISACSSVSSVKQPLDSEPITVQPQIDPLTLIARDFVNALSQLDTLQPAATTVALQTADRQDGFTLAMEDAFEMAGYGTRWVVQEGAGQLFEYRKDQEQAAGGVLRDIYELAVGSVEMRRGYARDAQQRVKPVTPLYVRGADASSIVLNDTLFDPVSTAATSGIGSSTTPDATRRANTRDNTLAQNKEAQIQAASIDAVGNPPGRRIQNTASPTLGLQNSARLQVPDDASPLDPLVVRATTAPPVSLSLLDAPTERNVFDLGGSNFQNLLVDYTVVKEQVLTFANDSMRLGELNKQLVDQLVEKFDPQTDVFSVLGCSMGPTAVKGGNAALALGRADRVVQALRFAGVEDEQILDEGCWAGDGSLESLPRRGVVVTLNRRS